MIAIKDDSGLRTSWGEVVLLSSLDTAISYEMGPLKDLALRARNGDLSAIDSFQRNWGLPLTGVSVLEDGHDFAVPADQASRKIALVVDDEFGENRARFAIIDQDEITMSAIDAKQMVEWITSEVGQKALQARGIQVPVVTESDIKLVCSALSIWLSDYHGAPCDQIEELRSRLIGYSGDPAFRAAWTAEKKQE